MQIEALNWPERCPHCGQGLQEGNVITFDLKIRKGLKAMLVAGFGSKKYSGEALWYLREKGIKYQNDRRYRGHGNVRRHYRICYFKKVKSVEYVPIIGAAVWLGIILMAAAEVGMKKGIGMECRLLSMNKWTLKFRNDLFYNEFLSLDARHVERT